MISLAVTGVVGYVGPGAGLGLGGALLGVILALLAALGLTLLWPLRLLYRKLRNGPRGAAWEGSGESVSSPAGTTNPEQGVL